MKTPPALTKDKLYTYIKFPMLFRKEQWIMESGEFFGDVVQDWQEKFLFNPLDKKDEKGLPYYNLLYFQHPKKYGKTTLIAGECVLQLLLSPYPSEENYLLGGDKEQAAFLMNYTKQFIQRNPNLDAIIDCYKNEIVIKSTGAKITILSSEAATKQGKNPDFFVFDEFWNQPNRDLWDTMWLGLAAKSHGKGIIITNAGFDKKTICYTIKKICQLGKHKRTYYHAPVGEELKVLKTPWITKEWIAQERDMTAPHIYKRFRLNEWVTQGQCPFMPEEGWECFKPYLTEKSICSVGSHVVGVDIGLTQDAAAAVVLHRYKGKIVVDQIRVWHGSKDVAIPISDIDSYLVMALKNFSNCSLAFDPYQAIASSQKFRSAGVQVKDFHFTVQNIVKLSKNLFYLLKNMTIEIPRNDGLETELKTLQAVDKSYGWRIDHEKGGTSDITIALGMAALIAMEKGIEDDEIGESTLSELYFLDQSSIFKSSGKRQFNLTDNVDPDLLDEAPKVLNTTRIF